MSGKVKAHAYFDTRRALMRALGEVLPSLLLRVQSEL